MRRTSARNPTPVPPAGRARTHEKMTTSASRPYGSKSAIYGQSLIQVFEAAFFMLDKLAHRVNHHLSH